jgi:hypothetical protein
MHTGLLLDQSLKQRASIYVGSDGRLWPTTRNATVCLGEDICWRRVPCKAILPLHHSTFDETLQMELPVHSKAPHLWLPLVQLQRLPVEAT